MEAISLKTLAKNLGLELIGKDREVTGVNTLEEAGPKEVSFLANPKYAGLLDTTRAGAVILSKDHARRVGTALVSRNPYLDFARAAKIFAKPQGGFEGHSSLAYIHPEALVDPDAVVYPFVYVGPRAEVGPGVKLFAGVYVGEDCRIGADTLVYPNASLMAGTVVGQRAVIHAGVVLGSDGFGFAQAGPGREKVPQIGHVQIGDDVEIGAGSTVDRAALGATMIGNGTKIDNLVQIGHNVKIGENCVIVALTGIAGSTRIGDRVVIGGQAGIVGHLKIGDDCMLAARSAVAKDLPPGSKVGGEPAMDAGIFRRYLTLQPKIPDMAKRIKNLEKELSELKSKLASEKKK